MGYRFYDSYIDDKEFPTLAEQQAQELVILAEMRQAQAQRREMVTQECEAARYEWLRIKRERLDYLAQLDHYKRTLDEQLSGEWIYFILDPNIELIKIGFTSRLITRFRELQRIWTGDLQFLGALRGSPQDEKVVHRMFEVFRCKLKPHREWFFDMPPLYLFIEYFAEVKELEIRGDTQINQRHPYHTHGGAWR